MLPVFKYPGVYIEEIPSAVHRVAGVPTSIAAFVGWTPRGPVNQATLVKSWQDFQTQFGAHCNLGSTVKQFFANGGQQAYIARDGTTPMPAEADLAVLLKTAIQNLPVHRRRR
jgi:Bacteriophage tail sheath protein